MIALILVAAVQSQPTTFTSDACHFSLRVPSGWSISKDNRDFTQDCTFIVRPLDWQKRIEKDDDVDLYTITISTSAGTLEAQAEEHGFVRRNGRWITLGRQGARDPADEIRNSQWRGVRGIRSTGCFRQAGGYAGLCEVDAAFVSDGKWSASIEALPQSSREFKQILDSFRFR